MECIESFLQLGIGCSSSYTQYNPINWILDYTLQIDQTLVLPLIALFSPDPIGQVIGLQSAGGERR